MLNGKNNNGETSGNPLNGKERKSSEREARDSAPLRETGNPCRRIRQDSRSHFRPTTNGREICILNSTVPTETVTFLEPPSFLWDPPGLHAAGLLDST